VALEEPHTAPPTESAVLVAPNHWSSPPDGAAASQSGRYKWVALSNTTLGTLMATLDSTIMLIALPDIFRGIGIDPRS
jgi:hypothetical protein